MQILCVYTKIGGWLEIAYKKTSLTLFPELSCIVKSPSVTAHSQEYRIKPPIR